MSRAFKCDYCGTLDEGVPFVSKNGGSVVFGAHFTVTVTAKTGAGADMEICKDCAQRFINEAFPYRKRQHAEANEEPVNA